jgi:hypothetical protein
MQRRPQQEGSLWLDLGRHTDPYQSRASRKPSPPHAAECKHRQSDERERRRDDRSYVLDGQERVMGECRQAL